MRRVSLLRRLHGDQRGITGVLTIVLMFVLLGIVAMAIDGGMLWRAHINIGNANDAAALAAAQEYATNGGCVLGATDPAVGQTGDGAAAGQANQAAQANVSTAAWDTRGEPSSPAYRVDRCQTNGTSGQVTVRYAYPKDMTFARLFGLDTVTVTGKAVAQWGIATSAGIAPFALDYAVCPQLTQPPPAPGTTIECDFRFDNDQNSARWGGMRLDTWGTTLGTKCNGSANPNDYANWLANPPIENLQFPNFVCADTGHSTPVWTRDLAAYKGQMLFWPLAQRDGTDLFWDDNNPYEKFKIIGVVGLILKDVITQDPTACGGTANNQVCVELLYPGPVTGGSGGGPGSGSCDPTLVSACVRAIKLVG